MWIPGGWKKNLLLYGVLAICGVIGAVFVLRVLNLLPQPQVTVVSSYLGWMSFFIAKPRSSRCRDLFVNRNGNLTRQHDLDKCCSDLGSKPA